jgi:uncharacterized protein
VGPLTIVGSLLDGLGRGADQLIILKAALDGFASMAFAAALGAGVMASVVAIVVVQGSLTLVGVLVGSALPEAQLASITATSGLLLLGSAGLTSTCLPERGFMAFAMVRRALWRKISKRR